MSKALIERIRKQRELKVEVGKFTFTARRPTDVEMTELNRGVKFSEMGARFVSGWANVTEDDILGGGGTDPVPFDSGLWMEWWADRTDFWEPVSLAILDAYKKHVEDSESATKNSVPG